MANIAITNVCNLKCQYCFAEDMIQEETKNIQTSLFEKTSDLDKGEKLEQIMDEINNKYGKEVLKRASHIEKSSK